MRISEPRSSLHPIDQAIAEMQSRRRARTTPPVTLQEFNELSRGELQALAMAWGVNAAANRQVLIVELYQVVHGLDRRVKKQNATSTVTGP